MTPGDDELVFSALDPASTGSSTAFFRVGTEPILVRHALGARHDHPGQVLAALLLGTLGGSALAAGATLGLVSQLRRPGEPDMGTAGWTTAGIGLVATLAAVWLGIDAETEGQPGATAVFALAPSSPAAR